MNGAETYISVKVLSDMQQVKYESTAAATSSVDGGGGGGEMACSFSHRSLAPAVVRHIAAQSLSFLMASYYLA
jgi:hypothetical protein